ncbi:MAG: B12-binding domain-containing radical SAM protein [Myxococcota bacterium]
MHVLLLNPPGEKIYLRDCYCSTISKLGYIWQPADLLVASGIFRSRYRISILDSIAERINKDKSLEKIKNINPDIVYMLASSISLSDDIMFAKEITKRFKNIKILCSGEPVLNSIFSTSYPFFDVIIKNYTSSRLIDIVEELKCKKDSNPIIIEEKDIKREFQIGLPLHQGFKKDKYWIPFVRMPFATLITDFGCPYQCKFCNSNLFYATRDLNEIIEDIRYIAKAGYRHIFIKDMTFLINRERSLQIAYEISRHNLTFNCYSRIDLVDEDVLLELKKMGLRLIQFGIEDYSKSILKSEGKELSIDKAISIFHFLNNIEVFTGAHFIINLPAHNGGFDFNNLLILIKDLRPSYISLNLFNIRSGSYYDRHGIHTDKIDSDVSYIKRLMFYSCLRSPSLIIDPIKDFNIRNITWYLKALWEILQR